MWSSVTRKSEARELPAGIRQEEISVEFFGGARPASRTTRPRKTIWLHMNLPLYSPSAARRRCIAGVRNVWTGSPLPNVAIDLDQSRAQCFKRTGAERRLLPIPTHQHLGCGRFPFLFRRQSEAGPTGEGIGFVIGDVADRFLGVHRFHAK